MKNISSLWYKVQFWSLGDGRKAIITQLLCYTVTLQYGGTVKEWTINGDTMSGEEKEYIGYYCWQNAGWNYDKLLL